MGTETETETTGRVDDRRDGDDRGYSGPERRAAGASPLNAFRYPSISSRIQKSSPAVMAFDALLVFLSVALGLHLWADRWGTNPEAVTYLRFGILSLPLWIVVFHWQGMYRKPYDGRLIADLRRVTYAVAMGAVMFILLGWPFGYSVPRGVVMVIALALVPLLLIERQVLRTLVRRRRRMGVGLRPVAILGTNTEAVELARELQDPVRGRRVVAFISTTPGEYEPLGGLPVVQGLDPTAAASALGVESVVIAATALTQAAPSALLRSFLDRGIEVEMTSALTGVANDRVFVNAVGSIPLLSIEPGHRGGWRAVSKRAFDLVVSSVMLLLASPVILISAIAVKVDSPGPVFFTQERVGRRGTTFRLHKLRTMTEDAEEELVDLREQNESDGALFKMSDDPRVTRVGKMLRPTSIDELPQLWNVVRGQMSLVGPRPALPEEAEQWNPDLRNRLRVRPGLTGMWQVSGRSETSFAEYQKLDLYYIDNWSIMTDLAIMLRTVPAVVARRGAS